MACFSVFGRFEGWQLLSRGSFVVSALGFLVFGEVCFEGLKAWLPIQVSTCLGVLCGADGFAIRFIDSLKKPPS